MVFPAGLSEPEEAADGVQDDRPCDAMPWGRSFISISISGSVLAFQHSPKPCKLTLVARNCSLNKTPVQSAQALNLGRVAAAYFRGSRARFVFTFQGKAPLR